MDNNMSIIEKLFDKDNNDNIVLYNNRGEALEFEQGALIPLDGQIYAILSPVTPTEDVAEGEGLVFHIDVSGEHPTFDIVSDDEIIDEVFSLYEGLFDLLDEESEEADDE